VLRIRDVYPIVFHPVSRIRIKNVSIFTQKTGFYDIFRVDLPGSRIRIPFFTHPGSRIQGSKRHRIPDPDPQHWVMQILPPELRELT
jgi:hypothetical protein